MIAASATAWHLMRSAKVLLIIAAMLVLWGLGLWQLSMSTLALVITAVLLALVVGVPLGVLGGESEVVFRIEKPILDAMQATPSFVYLIPAVVFFGVGVVPGVIATIVFSAPVVVKLTTLGIRQVGSEFIEVGQAFGCTRWQILAKVRFPLALQSVIVGTKQCIMMALAMVVVASMIGAPGLGQSVLQSLETMEFGVGVKAGLGIAILAWLLDWFIGQENPTVAPG